MDNKMLQERMDQFIPGMPDDPAELPELLFQVMLGKVYSINRWPDESTARGELTLAELEERFGEPVVKEGWYSATGEYLGAQPPGSLLDD
jgi:hypothetical protein